MKSASTVLVAERQWRSRAACRSADPDLFFPVSASGASIEQVTEAKAICARCPVLLQCREYALATREPYGVWGGLSEHDREEILGVRFG